jgi:hypothetical protein
MHQARLLRDVRGTIRRRRRRYMTIVRTDASLRSRRLIAAELPLDGLAEVLQQMKAVSNLPRLRRALAGGLCVDTRARSRLTTSTLGCCLNQEAVVATERLASTSTT